MFIATKKHDTAPLMSADDTTQDAKIVCAPQGRPTEAERGWAYAPFASRRLWMLQSSKPEVAGSNAGLTA